MRSSPASVLSLIGYKKKKQTRGLKGEELTSEYPVPVVEALAALLAVRHHTAGDPPAHHRVVLTQQKNLVRQSLYCHIVSYMPYSMYTRCCNLCKCATMLPTSYINYNVRVMKDCSKQCFGSVFI